MDAATKIPEDAIPYGGGTNDRPRERRGPAPAPKKAGKMRSIPDMMITHLCYCVRDCNLVRGLML